MTDVQKLRDENIRLCRSRAQTIRASHNHKKGPDVYAFRERLADGWDRLAEFLREDSQTATLAEEEAKRQAAVAGLMSHAKSASTALYNLAQQATFDDDGNVARLLEISDSLDKAIVEARKAMRPAS